MTAFAVTSRFAWTALFGTVVGIGGLGLLGAPAHAQDGSGDPAPEEKKESAETTKEDKRAAEKLFKAAFKLYKKEKDGDALKQLQDAINIWPEMPRSQYLLAEIHLMDGRISKAEQAFAAAIKAEPDFAAAHDSLGVCHLIKREYGQAQKCFETALEHDKRFSDAHLHLGMMYERQKKNRQAEIAYKTAIKLSPKSVLAHRRLGFFYLKANPIKAREAGKEFLLVTKLDPKDYDALFAYGYCLDAQDKYSAAQKIYQKVTRYDPKHAEAWRNLGLTHQRKGSRKEIDEALKCYKKYVEVGGKDGAVKQWIRQIETKREEKKK